MSLVLLEQAFERRAALEAQPDLDAYRLFHGFTEEPRQALTIDRYGPYHLIRCLDRELDIATAIEALKARGHGAPTKTIVKRLHRGAGAAEVAGAALDPSVVDADTIVSEGGLRFSVSLLGNRNTGLFLDARATRRAVRAAASERRVLNLFSYTGGYAVAAWSGGARSVINVDLSRPAHRRARVNLELNGAPTDDRDFVREDARRALKRYRRKDRRFDLIILEPPPAQRSDRARYASRQDFLGFARASLSLLEPRGLLFAICTDRAMQQSGQLAAELAALEPTRARLREPLERASDFPGDARETALTGYVLELRA
jgi:23S rRNA (cytosine1962-C5)-methyltransferase